MLSSGQQRCQAGFAHTAPLEAIPESGAIALRQDNAGSLPSGSLCEIEEGVVGVKMILAGLGAVKKRDWVSLESNSLEREG